MTIPDKAVEWALRVADSSASGYDQENRWGPDYDCSSLVIAAYRAAGVPLRATYTGNMRQDFLANGFRDVTAAVDLGTGAGLQRGDVLLHPVHHTALYVGAGRMVEAAGNELGGITGGASGDQNGREIAVTVYYDFPWSCVLRYEAENSEGPGGAYTVRAGDTLWGIAERFLGSGARYGEIMDLNGLTSTVIHPGQVLRLPGPDGYTVLTVTVRESTLAALKALAVRQGLTVGEVIDRAFPGKEAAD